MTDDTDFSGDLGITILDWRDGFARVALDVLPRHLNRHGIIHGGVLMTLLDEAGSMCGLWAADRSQRRSAVTVDLDCRFTGRASAGRVVATGDLATQGRSLFFTRVEARDEAGQLLAFGASTHKYRSRDGGR